MVELRKRKTPDTAAAPKAAPPAKKKTAPAKKAEPKSTAKPAETPAPKEESAAPAAPTKAGALKVGDSIPLKDSPFSATIRTNEDQEITITKLLEESKSGLVLFTYPKASTPGCTTQVCLFRDSYEPLTKTGLSIFGLSSDSPKANTTFKTKQNLPYPLLCDPEQAVIGAIGFKKPPKSTQRGVFVVDKSGKVLALEAGGPAATVEVVKRVVADMGGPAGEVKDSSL